MVNRQRINKMFIARKEVFLFSQQAHNLQHFMNKLQYNMPVVKYYNIKVMQVNELSRDFSLVLSFTSSTWNMLTC